MEKGVNGEVYNICAGELHSNYTMARKLLDIADLPEEGSITYVPDRQGNDRRYSMTSHKVRTLDWKPEMPFGEGMRYTYQWYKEMKDWWAELAAD
ncbi:MAG: hypothetical protein Q8O40_05420 [Chloroflexota bacterium]|nr:hypothetical protein [Chloroflexota bacterium]